MQAGGAAESGRALVQRWRAQAGVRALVERFDIEPFPDFSAK